MKNRIIIKKYLFVIIRLLKIKKFLDNETTSKNNIYNIDIVIIIMNIIQIVIIMV